MSDAELAAYLGIENSVDRDRIIAAMSSRERAAYEHLADTEVAIGLWLDGLGPLPQSAIVCGYRGKRL